MINEMVVYFVYLCIGESYKTPFIKRHISKIQL